MISRRIAAWLLRQECALWRTCAYLASHMDDALAVAEYEEAARAAARRLDVLSIQL